MKLIQYAKFALLYEKRPTILRDNIGDPFMGTQSTDAASINQPAIIDLDGIRLQSDTPTSAAQAARINERIAQWEGMFKEAL